MSTTLICLFPLIWTALMLYIGWYVGRHGSPVRWVGWRRRNGAATRVAREYDE